MYVLYNVYRDVIVGADFEMCFLTDSPECFAFKFACIFAFKCSPAWRLSFSVHEMYCCVNVVCEH